MIGRPKLTGGGLGLAGREDDLGGGLVDDLLREIHRVPDVERDGDDSGMGEGEQGDAPFGAIDGPQDRAIPGLETGVGQDRAARGTVVARSR